MDAAHGYVMMSFLAKIELEDNMDEVASHIARDNNLAIANVREANADEVAAFDPIYIESCFKEI